MLASKFVIERIMVRLREKNSKRVSELLKKYPRDGDLQKIGKEISAYFKKPSPSKLRAIEKSLKELVNFRKLDSGGGTMLWFSDRRARPPRKSR